jgi:hypothetical protein
MNQQADQSRHVQSRPIVRYVQQQKTVSGIAREANGDEPVSRRDVFRERRLIRWFKTRAHDTGLTPLALLCCHFSVCVRLRIEMRSIRVPRRAYRDNFRVSSLRQLTF